jgi:hypothetical protein
VPSERVLDETLKLTKEIFFGLWIFERSWSSYVLLLVCKTVRLRNPGSHVLKGILKGIIEYALVSLLKCSTNVID